MKNRKVFLMMLMCLALMLTACGGKDQMNLTKEQEKLIGEYAAITLLKYDAGSGSRLVDLSMVENQTDTAQEPTGQETTESETKEPQTTEPQAPPDADPADTSPRPEDNREQVTPAPDSREGEQEFYSLAEFLELPEGVEISSQGYEVVQNYGDNSNASFSTAADEGKELLLLYFTLSNHSGTTQQIDLLSRRDNYRIVVNEKNTAGALTTLLMNDLSTYRGSLEDGTEVGLVLVFETDREKLQDIASLTLVAKNALKSYTIQII